MRRPRGPRLVGTRTSTSFHETASCMRPSLLRGGTALLGHLGMLERHEKWLTDPKTSSGSGRRTSMPHNKERQPEQNSPCLERVLAGSKRLSCAAGTPEVRNTMVLRL